jgi:hypothetical protein
LGMNEDPEKKKLYAYLEALEAVNQELLTALKRCVEVLSQMEAAVPDQRGWMAILEDLNKVIRTADTLYEKKVIH